MDVTTKIVRISGSLAINAIISIGYFDNIQHANITINSTIAMQMGSCQKHQQQKGKKLKYHEHCHVPLLHCRKCFMQKVPYFCSFILHLPYLLEYKSPLQHLFLLLLSRGVSYTLNITTYTPYTCICVIVIGLMRKEMKH